MVDINEIDKYLYTYFFLGLFSGVFLMLIVSKILKIPIIIKPFRKLAIAHFNGVSYNGRYKKDGSIEFIRVQKEKVNVFVRFEDDGEINLTYLQYAERINDRFLEVFESKNNNSKGVTFSFSGDGTYKVRHCENHRSTDNGHFHEELNVNV